MSYFVTIDNFRTWLNRAQRALVSKNKVRKDLWTDFCDIILFEEPEEHNTITISQSNYTSISTFLQTEGRSDTLKDDSILNWITTLHELRKILNEEIRYTATTRLSTPVPPESPEEKKYSASTVATQTNGQITTQSVLTSSSSDPSTTTTRVQTHPLI